MKRAAKRAITVCYNHKKKMLSTTMLVRDRSFVRFAILQACNALNVRYRKNFGFYRLSNEGTAYSPWVHPNSRFPLIKQRKDEVFEIKICDQPECQSDLDVIGLMVENLDDPDGRLINVQMGTSAMCCMIPIMYRKFGGQKIEKANEWNVLINENELVESDAQISEYDIEDGDTVRICRDVVLDDVDSDLEWGE